MDTVSKRQSGEEDHLIPSTGHQDKGVELGVLADELALGVAAVDVPDYLLLLAVDEDSYDISLGDVGYPGLLVVLEDEGSFPVVDVAISAVDVVHLTPLAVPAVHV